MSDKITMSNYLKFAVCLAPTTVACRSGAQILDPASSQRSKEGYRVVVPPQEKDVFQAELKRDTRLTVTITLTAPSISLEQCLGGLAARSGVHLVVTDAIKTRRITAFTSKLPLYSLMMAFARVTGFSWRAVTPGSANNPTAIGYELYQSSQARLVEQAAMRNSEEWEQRELKAKSEAVMAAINANLASQSKDNPSFADMLGEFSPSQLQRLAQRAAPDDVDVLVADNNSYMHDHLLFARPFASLPPQTQQSLVTQLSQPRADLAGHPVTYPDLSDRQIGIVAMNGDVRLGIVDADGKDLNTTHLNVQRKGLPGIDANDGSSPEINQAIDNGMVSLDGLTPAKREKRLRFAGDLKRSSLAAVLESIARQTGLGVVSDDYLSSRFTPYGWLLTDRDEYTLPEALEQIARAFAHRIRYEDGVLRVTTVTPGLDLRGEPPDAAVARMREIADKKLPMELDDYVVLGGLSRLQAKMMSAAAPYGTTQTAVGTNMQRLYPVLHLISLLSPAQRQQAERKEGLALADMRRDAKRAFEALMDRGMPALLPVGETPAQAGLYMRRSKTGEHAEEVQFLIVSDSAPKSVAAYRLRLP